eukprot:TRINITY_DN1087_c0_g1_i6.p1 TRINITY_DN1087_c0_g1~~TRINITY_DN1087_c0_g1_i6.p1  ORF type:complete len:376 (+),score=96.35 TRINITY_DN1087_c0_g1_i6:69-1196(+)
MVKSLLCVILATLISSLLANIPAHAQEQIDRLKADMEKLKKENNLGYTDRPTIGVLSQPSEFPEIGYPASKYSYIAASYTKFVEMAGARAVPIRWDLPYDQLKTLFHSVNGLLLPGGGNIHIDEHGKHTPHYLAHKYLLELVVAANENGTYYPVWSVCMGYEFMMIAFANDNDTILSDHFVSHSHNLPQIFLPGATQSRMFKDLDPWLQLYIQTSPAQLFNHFYGVEPKIFNSNPILNSSFNVLSVAYDSTGREFIASIEHKKYPVYGVQHHPEKSIFEWMVEVNASHTIESIRITQHLANLFNTEARKNSNNFTNADDEYRAMIYNYNTVQINDSFVETYFFENYNSSQSLGGQEIKYQSRGFLSEKLKRTIIQ